MVTFRSNNNRRPPFRTNNNRRPPFRRNDDGAKFSNNNNFQRKVPGRNNHNVSNLIDKYNDLAREALANEDKILSENYTQHADHFTRVQNEQESNKTAKDDVALKEVIIPIKAEEIKEASKEPEVKKPIEKKIIEKKSV
tara:strand:- start:443 stop:859 length:417 start_codon:yes stop_codon:yes gene_type:complete